MFRAECGATVLHSRILNGDHRNRNEYTSERDGRVHIVAAAPHRSLHARFLNPLVSEPTISCSSATRFAQWLCTSSLLALLLFLVPGANALNGGSLGLPQAPQKKPQQKSSAYTLTPNLSGAGTVTSGDGRINCTNNSSGGKSGICSATYATAPK
jgi:hypothetical protein